MAARTATRAAAPVSLVVALLAMLALAVAGSVAFNAASAQTVKVVASDGTSSHVTLGVGKSVVINLPRDVKDVLVADPKIANAVVRSSRRAYIIGITSGATNVFFFDSEGKQIAGYDIAVTRDVNVIRTAIQRLIPDAIDLNVEGIGDGIVLSGTVANQAEAQQACDIASHFVAAGNFSGSTGQSGGATVTIGGGGSSSTDNSCSSPSSKVVNSIVVRGRDQVMLKVTVAEVERDIVKQLGINLSGSLGYGTAVVNFNNTNPFSAYGQSLSGSAISGSWKNINATLQAMEQAGVVHLLAEPNLTAISGETATFVAGGQFPILNGYSCSATSNTPGAPTTCQPSITFKNFGVSLNFTPVVLSAGRISLKVLTEVSDLSSANSLVITQPGTTATATIPSIRTRRADTTVEIPSGGSLAMAGMIQDETRHNINGFPGLMELPILGPLFKSNDYVNQRTELMILVTPYIVRAVSGKDLSRPDDGFADPSDPAQVLLGNFNRLYGVGGKTEPPHDTYHGNYGFILD
ncbi:MAG: type II and III secretion system protein family protein [Xanthobacteraceae bacterium]